MKPTANTGLSPQGFTLIEVIVTIIAAGILAAFFVQFMGTSMSKASISVERVQAESGGEQVAEKIIADYVAAMNSNPAGAFAAITTNIDNNTYDNSSLGIDVQWVYVAFDPATGNQVITSPTPSNTLRITVQVTGYNQVFLLGESRTANDQPHIRF